MSETTKLPTPGSGGAEAAKFTDRELQILSWAMQCLKSGPPDIDYEKLAQFAGMTNPRSASNAWAAVKKKLMMSSDGTVPLTPRKGGGRKRKVDGEDGEATPRKRANKDPEDSDASPKKKSRTPKPKPKQEPEDEDSKVKAESESANDVDAEGEEV